MALVESGGRFFAEGYVGRLTAREIDGMARELLAGIQPMVVVGLEELSEHEFVIVARCLHAMVRARSGRLAAQMENHRRLLREDAKREAKWAAA